MSEQITGPNSPAYISIARDFGEVSESDIDSGAARGIPRGDVLSVKNQQIEDLYGGFLHSLPYFLIASIAFSYYAVVDYPGLILWVVCIHIAHFVVGLVAALFRWSEAGRRYLEGKGHKPYLLVLSFWVASWGGLGFSYGVVVDRHSIVLYCLAVMGLSFIGTGHSTASRMAILIWFLLFNVPVILALSQRLPSADAVWGAGLLSCMLLNVAHTLYRHRLSENEKKENNDTIRSFNKMNIKRLLAESESREKSRFLAAVSHDLRQPIHALGLFANALDKNSLKESDKSILDNLNKCIESLGSAFNAMLDASKLDVGAIDPEIQTFEIRDLFRRLHMTYAGQAANKGLQLRFNPGGRVAVSDPQLMERVLGNLIQNAIRYTPQGGVLVLARGHGSEMTIEVWDTGEGISVDQMPRIFDEFYQVRRSTLVVQQQIGVGAGMGLAIVKRLALLMNHRLDVKSKVGRGSVFRLFVPQQPVDKRIETEPLPARGVLKTKGTIVVIDDDPVSRDGSQLVLSRLGYRVVSVSSLNEAKNAVVHHAEDIRGVVSDLRLRSGEDGLLVIEAICAAAQRALPVVLITSDDASLVEVRRAHESGHVVLFRPVLPRDLMVAVQEMM